MTQKIAPWRHLRRKPASAHVVRERFWVDPSRSAVIRRHNLHVGSVFLDPCQSLGELLDINAIGVAFARADQRNITTIEAGGPLEAVGLSSEQAAEIEMAGQIDDGP